MITSSTNKKTYGYVPVPFPSSIIKKRIPHLIAACHVNKTLCMLHPIFCITSCQLHDGAPVSNSFQHSLIMEFKRGTAVDRAPAEAASDSTFSNTLRCASEARLADTQKAHERCLMLLWQGSSFAHSGIAFSSVCWISGTAGW
jgi:hypothetical protein